MKDMKATMGVLTGVQVEGNPLARNVIEIEIIGFPEFHVTRVPD